MRSTFLPRSRVLCLSPPSLPLKSDFVSLIATSVARSGPPTQMPYHVDRPLVHGEAEFDARR
jgi:hypothetical protein